MSEIQKSLNRLMNVSSQKEIGIYSKRTSISNMLLITMNGGYIMTKVFQQVRASVIIYKDNKILLRQRKDNQCWRYHGGCVELGEIVEDSAKRELLEETGLTANYLEQFGIFSGPELYHIYPDGKEVHIIDIVFLCDNFLGVPIFQAEECLDLKWFEYNNIPENLSPPIIHALNKFIEERQTVGIDEQI